MLCSATLRRERERKERERERQERERERESTTTSVAEHSFEGYITSFRENKMKESDHFFKQKERHVFERGKKRGKGEGK